MTVWIIIRGLVRLKSRAAKNKMLPKANNCRPKMLIVEGYKLQSLSIWIRAARKSGKKRSKLRLSQNYFFLRWSQRCQKLNKRRCKRSLFCSKIKSQVYLKFYLLQSMTQYLVSLCQWLQRVTLMIDKRSYLKGFKMKLILKTINPNQVHKFRVVKVLKK